MNYTPENHPAFSKRNIIHCMIAASILPTAAFGSLIVFPTDNPDLHVGFAIISLISLGAFPFMTLHPDKWHATTYDSRQEFIREVENVYGVTLADETAWQLLRPLRYTGRGKLKLPTYPGKIVRIASAEQELDGEYLHVQLVYVEGVWKLIDMTSDKQLDELPKKQTASF